MATYYVATDGSNSANGSSASPWKTINFAMQSSALKAGDVVVVRSGTYNEAVTISKGGSASGDITLKAEVPGEALIRPPSTGWNAISINANYVTIDGFDIKGARGDGIEGNGVHHIRILNNTVSGSGESGIQFNWSEFLTIEGNETFENGSTGWFSGISIYQNRNITGDTTTSGFRTIVRNNISHDNVTKSGQHTDGNGIIIDDFQSTQTSGYRNYTFPTLVEGNLVYENGGKGIQVTWSDYVTVRNNTAWHNNQDLLNTGTWRGELSNSASSNNTWVNNIAVADPSINRNNTAIDNTSTSSYVNKNIVWANNITYNGTAGQASVRTDGGNAAPSTANGNKLGVDPLFVNPANGDFHVKAGSPAIDSGTSALGLPTTDLTGGTRVIGTVDIGAYEQGSSGGGGGTTNQAPTAKADAGFVTSANTALTISAATLLANDSDPDGNPISLTGVSAPSHGTVKVSGSNVIFTPDTGYTGAAAFTYTISDGKGGTASAKVDLSVNAPTASNAAPTFTSGSSFSLNENSKTVGSVTARDAEGDALTFAKSGGTDAALFNVDAKTGAISFITAPDYERPADANGDNVYVLGVSVTDGKHTPVATTLQISVKDVAETTAPVAASSFFAASARPAATETRDTADYELGMKFRALEEGDITALKYYRGSGDASDTDVRTLHLWSSGGRELAEGTFTSAPGATGWQVAKLSAPVHVSAGTQYVVSYGTTQNYADSVNYFNGTTTNADGTISVSANAGVFSIKGGSGGPGFFPTQVWNASNYWADVVLERSSTSSGAVAAPAPEPTPEPAPQPTGVERTGTSGADTLIGGDGNDILRGYKGNDRLIGNGGADELRGGGGADTHVYSKVSDSTPDAPDVIYGFARGVDRIDLTATDAVAGDGNDAFSWIGSRAFSGTAGELRTEGTSDGLVLQGDVDGDGRPDLAIAIDASFHTLAASDVLL